MVGLNKTPLLLVCLAFSLVVPQCLAAMSVALNPSVPSPAPVGTIVTWNPTVASTSPGTLWYRYRARPVSGDFRMVRDFGPLTSLDWTASDWDGNYELELSVRNLSTGESASAIAGFEMTSRVTDSTPVINPTSNPLVFLYSAPPCPASAQIRVRIETASGSIWTPYKTCQAERSVNFYLSGMPAGSTNVIRQEVQSRHRLEEGPSWAGCRM